MSATLADSLDDLTPAWFTAALRDGGAIKPETTVATADVALYGTGQLGLVARAELSYDGGEGPASAIIKLPSHDPGSRGLGVAMGAYEGEVRFYQEIAPRTAMRVPRPYWSSFEPGTGRVTLVLEDLTADWQVGDMMAGSSRAQNRAALAEVARLQADLWDTADLRDLGWLSAPARTQMLFDQVAMAVDPFLARFAPHLSPDAVALIEKLAPLAATYPARAFQRPLVVAHGDFRLDNVLFTPDCLAATIIDWQGLRLGPPGMDVAIWLATSMDPDTRRAAQDELITHWHNALVAGGVTGFSRADAIASVTAGVLWPLLLGVPMSLTLQQSERGDAMFAALVARSAELAADLGAGSVLS
ncbi:MAG TPA: phosphotransferase [Sporichthyaceae bacterium]|jgi:thiamine kinase-like enzyme